MSAQAERQVPASYTRRFEDPHDGWVMFGGVLMFLLGTLNIIDGIAAISKSHFYAGNAHYVFGDLKTWGWVALCIGVVQLLAGLGLFTRNQLARWTAVVVLSLNAIAQLLMMPAYPLWSLSIFAVDIVAVYGLVAYGGRATEN